MMKIQAQETGTVGSNILRDSKVSFTVGEKEFDGDDARIANKDNERKLSVEVSRLLDENTNRAGALIVELTPLNPAN